MKKIVLFFLLSIPAFLLVAQNHPIYCGDANADGEVNNADIITIQNYILKGTALKTVDYDQQLLPTEGTIRIQLNDNKVLIIPGTNIISIDNEETQEEAEHQSVDLGLPSKTLWASCNIGAASPYDAGSYFNASNASQDVAKAQWQDKWETPTTTAIKELIDNCNWTWSAENKGFEVKSKSNENSIFLPAGGYMEGICISEFEVKGYYWSDELYGSSEESSCFVFSSLNTGQPQMSRQLAFNIRPIIKPQDPSSTPSGDIEDMTWEEE